MNAVNYVISLLPPNVVAIVVMMILAYATYYVYSYRKILLVIALVSVAGYISYMVYAKDKLVQKIDQSQVYDGFEKTSLGYSLNNPGNIRVTNSKSVGEVYSSAPFKKFSNMKYGFRAMTELLHVYVNNGSNTIDKIINRYAPASDGNTPESYIAEVARNSNVKRDQILTEGDFRNGNMLNIMYFMTRVEQGYAPNIKDLSDGFDMYYNK